MPTPNPAPLRVAECHACQQLFAVYAIEGAVACPSCGVPVEVATLETASLGVAEPIEVQIEAPPAPTPAVPAVEEPTETPVTVAAPAAEEPADADKPPTVAEWLLRNDEPAEPVAAAEPSLPEPAAEPAAKPTLSESLGWNESLPGFDPPVAKRTTPAAEEAALPGDSLELSPAASELSQTPSDEFRFDLGSTPLSETSTDVISTDIEASQPSELLWEGGESETGGRGLGWFKPLAGLAALLLIAGVTGAYLMRDGEPAPLAEANRGGRLLEDPVDDGLTPPDPYAAIGTIASTDAPETTVPPPEPASEPAAASPIPIRDPATRTVGYDAPPSNPPAAAALEDLPLARPTPEQPSKDRYASFDGGSLDALPPAGPPSAPTQEPLPIAPARQQVGLAGVPLTTVDQLVAATAEAAPSGQAFVMHDLADREQAPVLGQHYARLSYLAQTLTLLDPAEQAPQYATAEMEAVDVFGKLFRGSRGRSQALQIAGPWISWRDRPYGGVFFSGDPVGIARAGSVSRFDFKVGEQTIPVIMPKELDVQRLLVTGAVELGVLGVIVEEPQKWIAGYEGDAERVIWARKTIPLRPPVEL